VLYIQTCCLLRGSVVDEMLTIDVQDVDDERGSGGTEHRTTAASRPVYRRQETLALLQLTTTSKPQDKLRQ